MEFKPTSPRARRAGFTLVEMLVATAIGVVVTASALSFFLFSLRSFAAMTSYSDLNSKDRNATDLLSRDIRTANALVSATTNQLVLAGSSGNITYTYDATTGLFTRTDSGGSRTLLSQIDSFAFTLYQRPATNSAYDTFPVGTTANAKLVAFQWTCSRQVDSARLDTETVQMGLVSMRNQ